MAKLYTLQASLTFCWGLKKSDFQMSLAQILNQVPLGTSSKRHFQGKQHIKHCLAIQAPNR